MPNSIIHLFVAKKVNHNAEIDFYIGNLAPDSVIDQKIKSTVHFRSAADRKAALEGFASTLDRKNEYIKGVILHLFVDLRWEETPLVRDFIENQCRVRDNKYWNEIGHLKLWNEMEAATYAFTHTDWSRNLLEQMEQSNIANFTEMEHITKNGLKAHIHNQWRWMEEKNIEPSKVFTPMFIEKFSKDTAGEFTEWFLDLDA